MIEESMLPDFLVIGAQKAGTSALHDALRKHPAICMPQREGPLKELHFFDRNANFNRGIDHYKRFFEHCQPGRLVGEVTPNYLFNPESCHRIKWTIPNAKLIACLREPIDRAFSHYKMEVLKDGLGTSFETAIATRSVYLHRGFYASQLRPYFAAFGPDQIHVCFYDDLVEDPKAFYRQLAAFLDVDPTPFTDVSTGRAHEGGWPKSHSLTTLTRWARTLYSPFGRHLKGSRLGESVDRAGVWIKDRLARLNTAKGDDPTISPVTTRLLQMLYRRHNLALEELLGRIPESWQYQRAPLELDSLKSLSKEN